MVEFAIDEREKGEMINAKSIINFASIARFWDRSLDIYHVIIDSSFNCRDYPLIMVNYHCWQGTKKILGLPKPLMKVVEKHKKLTFNLKTAWNIVTLKMVPAIS